MSTFGPAYDPAIDGARIKTQFNDILYLMLDAKGVFMTLAEIETKTGYPQSSISAQLRHMRKPKFGGYLVDKQRRMNGKKEPGGTWEYRVTARY